MDKIKILIVEDEAVTAMDIKNRLQELGYSLGTTAAQYISEHFYTPIIFLSAYSDEDTVNRAKLSSPYGYLSKPIEIRDLTIAIELALFKHAKETKIIALALENANLAPQD